MAACGSRAHCSATGVRDSYFHRTPRRRTRRDETETAAAMMHKPATVTFLPHGKRHFVFISVFRFTTDGPVTFSVRISLCTTHTPCRGPCSDRDAVKYSDGPDADTLNGKENRGYRYGVYHRCRREVANVRYGGLFDLHLYAMIDYRL